jgi:hypothetical protein
VDRRGLSLIALGVALVAAALIVGHPHSSTAAKTCNLTKIDAGGQQNYNYDFTSKEIDQIFSSAARDLCANAQSPLLTTNVDWADSILFYDGAYTTDVGKNVLGWGCEPKGIPCASEHGWSWQGDGNPAFDDAEGVKDSPLGSFCGGESTHIRVHGIPGGSAIAGSSGFRFNPFFGYWVWATTHVDHAESGAPPCPPPWYAEEDVAAARISAVAVSQPRVIRAFENCCFVWNIEPHRIDGDHIWQNDGQATYIHVKP